MSTDREDEKREEIAEAVDPWMHGGPLFRRPAGKIIILIIPMTVIGIFLSLWLPSKIMPADLASAMSDVNNTIVLFSILATPVAALVFAIAIYSLHRWRKKGPAPDEPPPDGPPLRGNTVATSLWLGTSVVLVVVLLVWGMAVLASQQAPQRNTITIDVVGQQWLWTFKYPGTGVESTKLVVPANREVRFSVTSEDVTHGFWPNSLGIQVDANPGFTTIIQTEPTKLGTFEVRCSQLCGLYHAYMDAQGQVVTSSQFSSWLTSQGATASAAQSYALGKS